MHEVFSFMFVTEHLKVLAYFSTEILLSGPLITLAWFSAEILLSESLKVLDWFLTEILLYEARGTLILGKTQETVTVDYVSDSHAREGGFHSDDTKPSACSTSVKR